MNKTSSYGFTLIELLIVIGILGILAAAITVPLLNSQKKARDFRRDADMAKLVNALKLYVADKGSAPVVTAYGETSTGGWDYSYADTDGDGIFFLDPLVEEGYIGPNVIDPLNNGVGDGPVTGYAYRYYNYDVATSDISLCYKSEVTNLSVCPLNRSKLY